MDDRYELNTHPAYSPEESKFISITSTLAAIVAALVDKQGFVSPSRLNVALSVTAEIGSTIGQPSLAKVQILRALSQAKALDKSINQLKVDRETLPHHDRVNVVRALVKLIDVDATDISVNSIKKIAVIFDVQAPEHLRRESASSLTTIAGWANSLIYNETPIMRAARAFADDFGEVELLHASKNPQIKHDQAILIRAIQDAVLRVTEAAKAAVASSDAQTRGLDAVADLEAAASEIERLARQRFASITRRAKMLKRHCKEDLIALSEDAVEEFENDLQRLAANKGLLKRSGIVGLNERQLVKNLERRYKDLARRYQEQLDLLAREVAEFADEFTQVVDEALEPIARFEFRTVSPQPRLEHRVKIAADRATQRTFIAGGAGIVGSGAAIHAGLMSGAVLVGVAATPIGIVVLGTLGLAGMWAAFTSPAERQKRDMQERGESVRSKLHELVMARLPEFEDRVDEVVSRFQKMAEDDIATPRVSAGRLTEIAKETKTIAETVAQTAQARIEHMMLLLGK